jgi:hypothetical protein
MPQSVDPLPQGHGLLEYSIERVLGQGGFGTTYLCRDGHLQKQVVIKEFTPHRLLKREPGGDLKPVNGDVGGSFSRALSGFLEEARIPLIGIAAIALFMITMWNAPISDR